MVEASKLLIKNHHGSGMPNTDDKDAKVAKSDWLCKCGYKNFAKRKCCNVCGTSKGNGYRGDVPRSNQSKAAAPNRVLAKPGGGKDTGGDKGARQQSGKAVRDQQRVLDSSKGTAPSNNKTSQGDGWTEVGPGGRKRRVRFQATANPEPEGSDTEGDEADDGDSAKALRKAF